MSTDRRTRPGRVSLMRTAIALMGRQGYEGTSTRDIANEAGVSVAALYYHFPSKLDLLREFLHEAHDVVVMRVVRDVAAAGPDPQAQLDAAVSTLIASNIHDDWAKLAAQVAWREHDRLEQPDQDAIEAKRVRIAKTIERVIRDGVDEGVFTTTDATDVSRVVLNLCMGAADPAVTRGRSMAAVIEQHQRFATALAHTPPKPKRGTRRAP